MPNRLSEISIEGQKFPLEIKNFKSSKSIKLRVIQGRIVLTKSPRTPINEALGFVEANAKWLLAKLKEKAQSLSEFLQNLGYLYIEQKPYKIILVENSSKSLIINDSKAEVLLSFKDEESLREVLLVLAKKILPKKALEKAKNLAIAPPKISVRSQRSLWGSRSSSGTLSLNWRIILLEEALQDYIICHELAHIKFMDHSTSFWLYLSTLCPQAKRLDRQLALVSLKIFKVI